MKKQLETYCETHWWNCGIKEVFFKGTLGECLKKHSITYTKRKTEYEGIFYFTFKSSHGITFKTRGTMTDFIHHAKQSIQMELVRMGDKSQLYVSNCWRPLVTINF
jgi:hypothetical protein